MDADPKAIRASDFYRHMIHVIAPRPIAWVSTCSAAGANNLAPFSFFTGVGANPPSVLFCPSNRRDGTYKDTLRNILETREFVINVVPETLAREMNLSSSEVAPEVSEFELAGVRSVPSRIVRPPGVAGSPVQLECRLVQHIPMASGPGAANVVIGEVVHLSIDEQVLGADGYADPARLGLIGRMGGNAYCRTTDRFDLPRPG